MAGDQVSATTMYYYQNPVVNTGSSMITQILSSLAQAITGSGVTYTLTKGAAGDITSQLTGSVPFGMKADPDAADGSGNAPKAYLSVLFFDERFNFVQEGSLSLRVSQSGTGAAALVLSNIKAPKNGYAYVYVSNSSDEMVYFDNLQVAHNRGRIIEENHYYAYGLKIAGISSRKLADVSEGHIENKDLYNDKELIDDAELNWYDYGFRSYDAQIGRFPQLDPLTDGYPYLTPYQYGNDDPITNIDIDGLEGASSVIRDFSYNITTSSNLFVPATSFGTATVARQVGSSVLRVAIKNGAVQTARIIAMKAAQKTVTHSFLEILSKATMQVGGRLTGIVGLLLDPVDAGTAQPTTPAPKGMVWGGDYYVPSPKFSPNPTAEPRNNPKTDDEDEEDNDEYVYRGGGFTDAVFTPRPKDADEGPKSGVSTFTDPLTATQGGGGKVQVLSVSRLRKLGFQLNYVGGHVGIRPKSQRALVVWAATRAGLADGKAPHLLTKILKKARVRQMIIK